MNDTLVIAPGTIPCIDRRCKIPGNHRHRLQGEYATMESMVEDPTFRSIVTRLCRFYGLQCDHRRALAGNGLGGWPDLTIFGGTKKGILFRELKRFGQGPSAAQREMGRLLTRSGGDFAVWTPEHLYRGIIETELIRLG